MSYTIAYHVHHNHTPDRPVTVQAAPEQVRDGRVYYFQKEQVQWHWIQLVAKSLTGA
jgi:hypothetical protein